MIKKGYVREYFGILIAKQAYVKIYATSRENAIRAFDNRYSYKEAGNVYTSKEFEFYSTTRFKQYVQAEVIGKELYMAQLANRGIV